MSSPDAVFDKNIPAQRDPYAQWQIDLQNNFSILYDIFSKNHVAFYSENQSSTADQGKHTFVELNSSVDPQTSINENNLYTKLDVNGAAQLFMAMQNNTSNFQYSSWQSKKDDVEKKYISSLPGNFVVTFGEAVYKGINTPLPLNSNNKEVVYATAVPIADPGVSSGVNFFIVQVAPDVNKQNSILFTWNSTLSLTVPPKRFLYFYIEKLNDV